MNDDDSDTFYYSDKYYDDHYEYRYVNEILDQNRPSVF